MKTAVIVIIGAILVLGLLVGSFGCASPAPSPTPTSTPSPTPTTLVPSPSPSPKPTSPTPAPSPTQSQVIEWDFQTDYPLAEMAGRRMGAETAKWLEEITEGQLKIKVWDKGAFAATTESFEALRKGVFEALYTYGEYHSQKVPEVSMINLPLLVESAWEAWDMEYQRGANKILSDVYAKNGIKVFFNATNQQYNYGLTFVAQSIKDLKGKKIRAVGPYATLTTKLGGAPVNIPAGEIFMGLQTGVIDGYIQGIAGAKSAGTLALTRSYLFPTLSPIPNCVTGINMDAWNKLPANLQQRIERNWPLRGLEIAAQYTVEELHEVSIMEKEYKAKPVYLSAEDMKELRRISQEIWQEAATKSPECKQLYDIAVQMLKDYGRL